MTISLVHAFVSAAAEGTDATKVRKSNWNAEHTLTQEADRILGRLTDAGATQELTGAQVRTLLSLVIGTNVQAWDSDLDAIAALSRTRGDIIAGGAAAWQRVALGTSGYHLQSDGTDAGWAGFVQSGTGASTRTWQNKLRDVVSVKDFGAVGDNSNDDTAEIQAAIDAVVTAGGGTVYFPRGKYKISATLNIRVGGVFLAGAGAFYSDETASALTRARAENASQIVWDAAAAGSKMIRFFPNGPDDDTPIRPTGGGMRDLFVDGSNDATHCIEVLSWVGLQFSNVHAAAATTVGWNLGTYTAGSTDSKYTSGYHSFYNCSYLDGSNSSDPLAMWGAAGLYNTCLSQFFGCTWRGNRISIGDADSNYFYGCKWGATFRLEAQGTSPYSQGNYYAARNNVIFGSSGLVTALQQTSVLLPDAPHSCNNFLIGHTNDAGGPLPTIEASADLTVWATSPVYLDRKGGAMYGNALMGTKVQLAATQAIANGTTTAVTWPDPTSHNPLVIWASGNATRLTVPNGIKFVRIQATADFANDIDGERYADIFKNGADIICRATGWPLDTLSTAFSLDTGWFQVSATDYFELRVNHTAGASLNLNALTTNMTMDVK